MKRNSFKNKMLKRMGTAFLASAVMFTACGVGFVSADYVKGASEDAAEEYYTGTFYIDGPARVIVYKTKDLTEENIVDGNAGSGSVAVSRDKTTGEPTIENGRIIFVVEPEEGYEVATVDAEGGTYGNKLMPADLGQDNAYGFTNIVSDTQIFITVEPKSVPTPVPTEEPTGAPATEAPGSEPTETPAGPSEPTPAPYIVKFAVDEHSSITVYSIPDFNNMECIVGTNRKADITRDENGKATRDNGQVNFIVNVEEGYEIDTIEASDEVYERIKTPEEYGLANAYSFMGISKGFTITITTCVEGSKPDPTPTPDPEETKDPEKTAGPESTKEPEKTAGPKATPTPAVKPTPVPVKTEAPTPTLLPSNNGAAPARVSLKSLSKKKVAKKPAILVKWKKLSGVNGYKIVYKTGKKTKTVTVNGASKSQYTIKKLKKGSKYSVYIYAFTKQNGKSTNGPKSKVKTIKL